jgi:hypothetical protein
MKTNNKYIAKFAIVAVMLGLFSPSIEVRTINDQTELSISLLKHSEARRGGNRNRNSNRNSNRNVNRNVNRNSNRNVNVNVNHYGGGHHGRYGYHGGHPIAAFATVVAIGTIVAAATMPTTCVTVISNNVSYRQCGSSYYMPVYSGSTVVYKSIASPF